MLALAPETTCGSRDCGFLRPLLASWKLVPVWEHLHVCRQGTGTSLATRAPQHGDTQQGSGGMGWRRWGWRWWEGSVGAHRPTEGPVVVVSWTIRAQGQGCKTSQKIWNKTQAGPCGDIPTRPTTKGSRLASNVIAVSHPCSQSRIGMRWEMVRNKSIEVPPAAKWPGMISDPLLPVAASARPPATPRKALPCASTAGCADPTGNWSGFKIIQNNYSKITFGLILRSIISLIWFAERASARGAGAVGWGGNQQGIPKLQ